MDASLSPPPGEGRSCTPEQFEQWLTRARAGSRSALGIALEAGRKRLLLAAHRSLDDKLKAKVSASDVVQDTFVEAKRDFGQFRGHTEAEFHGWLLGILSNRLSNNVRRYVQTQRRAVNRELRGCDVQGAINNVQDDAPTPGTELLAKEEQWQVRLALSTMDEAMRSVLIERTWRGDSFAEIGARRNCSAEAARKLWSRAVRQMRQLLIEIK